MPQVTMPRDQGLVDREEDDREDIHWFENYERRGKTGLEHLASLRNQDILDYIKDVQRNCRLEVSSGEDDYAGTRRSSNCSVRLSGAREFRSRSKQVGFRRVTSQGNKSAASSRPRRIKQQFPDRDTTDIRGLSFRDNRDPAGAGNPEETLGAPGESTFRRPRSSAYERGAYNNRPAPPGFYGRYSRKDLGGTWPATIETTSPDPSLGMDSSIITDRRSARVRAFRSLHRKRMDGPTYASIYSSVASDRKTRLENSPRLGEDRGRRVTQLSRSGGVTGDLAGFVDQPRLNEYRLDRGAYPSGSLHQGSSRKHGEHDGRYVPVRHPNSVQGSAQPASGFRDSRSNRLTTSTGLSCDEMSSQRRVLRRRENQVMESPLEAAGSIDRSHRRELWPGSNIARSRRREPAVPGERGSPRCRRPGFLTWEPGKLCKAARARDSKPLPGCCRQDDTERRDEETLDRTSAVHPADLSQCDFRSREKRTLLREASFRSGRRWDDHQQALDLDLPTGEQSPRRNETRDDASRTSMLEDVVGVTLDDADRANVRDDCAQLGDPEYSHLPSNPDWTYQTGDSSGIARRGGESSRDLENGRRRSREARTEARSRSLRRQVSKRGRPRGEATSSFVMRTPRELAPGDSRLRLRHVAAESVCKCREPFHDPPAACLVGCCSCVEDNGNLRQDDEDGDDSSRETSSEEVAYCCPYCCCSSSSFSSGNGNEARRKLESSYGKINTSREPSRLVYRATRTGEQRHPRDANGERDQFVSGNEAFGGIARPTGSKRLRDPAGASLGRSRYIRRGGGTNLEQILIYPPRGEAGPPLTLYKGSSGVNCRVRGDTARGFRYVVTYVQKFVSPTWMPGASPEVGTGEECCGSSAADHG